MTGAVCSVAVKTCSVSIDHRPRSRNQVGAWFRSHFLPRTGASRTATDTGTITADSLTPLQFDDSLDVTGATRYIRSARLSSSFPNRLENLIRRRSRPSGDCHVQFTLVALQTQFDLIAGSKAGQALDPSPASTLPARPVGLALPATSTSRI